MTSHALKEGVGAEMNLLPWQPTSYLSLSFVRNICGSESVMY